MIIIQLFIFCICKVNYYHLSQILTNIFKEEWNLFIDATMTITLKMKIFGGTFVIIFPEVATLESYASIGGK